MLDKVWKSKYGNGRISPLRDQNEHMPYVPHCEVGALLDCLNTQTNTVYVDIIVISIFLYAAPKTWEFYTGTSLLADAQSKQKR